MEEKNERKMAEAWVWASSAKLTANHSTIFGLSFPENEEGLIRLFPKSTVVQSWASFNSVYSEEILYHLMAAITQMLFLVSFEPGGEKKKKLF